LQQSTRTNLDIVNARLPVLSVATSASQA